MLLPAPTLLGPTPPQVLEKLRPARCLVVLMFGASVIRLILGDSILSALNDFAVAVAATQLVRDSSGGGYNGLSCIVPIMFMSSLTAMMNLFTAVGYVMVIFGWAHLPKALHFQTNSTTESPFIAPDTAVPPASNSTTSYAPALEASATSHNRSLAQTPAGPSQLGVLGAGLPGGALPTETSEALHPAHRMLGDTDLSGIGAAGAHAEATGSAALDPASHVVGHRVSSSLQGALRHLASPAFYVVASQATYHVVGGHATGRALGEVEHHEAGQISKWALLLPATIMLQACAQFALTAVCMGAWRALSAYLPLGPEAGMQEQAMEDHMLQQALAASMRDGGGRPGPVPAAGNEDPALALAIQRSLGRPARQGHGAGQDGDAALQMALRASLDDQRRAR